MGIKCEHYAQANDQISPNTKECEECEKEKTPWVALRMCLTCGHVGCCDSSVGLHATKTFQRNRTSCYGCTPIKIMEMVLYS